MGTVVWEFATPLPLALVELEACLAAAVLAVAERTTPVPAQVLRLLVEEEAVVAPERLPVRQPKSEAMELSASLPSS